MEIHINVEFFFEPCRGNTDGYCQPVNEEALTYISATDIISGVMHW